MGGKPRFGFEQRTRKGPSEIARPFSYLNAALRRQTTTNSSVCYAVGGYRLASKMSDACDFLEHRDDVLGSYRGGSFSDLRSGNPLGSHLNALACPLLKM